ncbi:Myblike DNAbinding domain-containing protein [Mortierella sp. AM989]|nr:Myblike DNAbinding domain-containing protein [Mortierella sp. AM989]
MALLEIGRLLQPTVGGGSLARLIVPPLRPTCSLIATLTAPRRFYHPSLPTFANSRLWTEKDDKKIMALIKERKSLDVFINNFPNRSVDSIAVRVSRLRKRHKDVKEELPSKHPPSTVKPWTVEEDAWLMDGVNRLGSDWTKIADEFKDGRRLGRAATSCRRRWEILLRTDKLRVGLWDTDESDRLLCAIRKQVPSRSGKKPQVMDNNFYVDLDLSNVNWKIVSEEVETRTDAQCRSHVYKTLRSKNSGQWTKDETDRLVKAIKKHRLNWAALADEVMTRSAFQVKQKYYLSRGLKRELAME